jgi:exoribonuclease R
MLPTCLSECLCSLVEKRKRFVFTFEIILNEEFEITETKFYNSLIIVNKNHVYESQALIKTPYYQHLFRAVQSMCYKSSMKLLPSIKNSHDVVTYLMIMMNYSVSRKLIDNEDGIFRSAFINKDLNLPNDLDEGTKNFITAWNSQAGEYVLCKDKQQHEWLKLETYCHITSPIRRLVDLLNSIIYQNKFGLTGLSIDAIMFVDKWKQRLDYINTCMKHIRRVQTECSLLSLFHEDNENGKYNTMKGILFDGCKRDDDMYIYNVYLPKVKLLSKLKVLHYIEDYKQAWFKLFYFKDENTLKQKIRLKIID